jgi:hypothetical protein
VRKRFTTETQRHGEGTEKGALSILVMLGLGPSIHDFGRLRVRNADKT